MKTTTVEGEEGDESKSATDEQIEGESPTATGTETSTTAEQGEEEEEKKKKKEEAGSEVHVTPC